MINLRAHEIEFVVPRENVFQVKPGADNVRQRKARLCEIRI